MGWVAIFLELHNVFCCKSLHSKPDPVQYQFITQIWHIRQLFFIFLSFCMWFLIPPKHVSARNYSLVCTSIPSKSIWSCVRFFSYYRTATTNLIVELIFYPSSPQLPSPIQTKQNHQDARKQLFTLSCVSVSPPNMIPRYAR